MPLLPNLLILFAITTALVFWLRNWLRTRRPGVRAMLLALLFLDLSLSIGPFETLTGLLSPAERLWGVFFVHVLCLAAAYWLVVFCMYLNNTDNVARRHARQRSVLLVITLALLAAFFLLGPVPEHLATVSSADGDKPFILPYLAVFTAYLGWSQLDVVMSSIKGWNARRWHLRWGVRLWVTGGAVGALYAVDRLLHAVLSIFDVRPPWPDYGTTGTGTLLLMFAIVLELTGIIITPLGTTWARLRAARQIRPLWGALIETAPDLRFTRNVDKLHARTTEIRDVLLGPLQPYLDPAVAARARTLGSEAGLVDDELTITTDAATIAVAIHSRRSGHQTAAPGTPLIISSPASTDPGDDAEWLVRMSRAFTESPVVATTVKEFTQRHDHESAH